MKEHVILGDLRRMQETGVTVDINALHDLTVDNDTVNPKV